MTLHKEGHSIIIANTVICVVVAACVLIFCSSLVAKIVIGACCLFMIGFMPFFFRVPKRKCVAGEDLIISPGDGKVVNIVEVEENEYFHDKCIRISIFLTFFNVHVTWYPAGGVIDYYKYHPGKYIFAWHPKSSEKNERTTIAIKTGKGDKMMFRQIAGIVAQRIVCYSKEGEVVDQNSQAGIIKFGSRLDVFVPIGTELLVEKGDKVRGQISPIARFK